MINPGKGTMPWAWISFHPFVHSSGTRRDEGMSVEGPRFNVLKNIEGFDFDFSS